MSQATVPFLYVSEISPFWDVTRKFGHGVLPKILYERIRRILIEDRALTQCPQVKVQLPSGHGSNSNNPKLGASGCLAGSPGAEFARFGTFSKRKVEPDEDTLNSGSVAN